MDHYPKCPYCGKIIKDGGPMKIGEERVVECKSDGDECIQFAAAYKVDRRISERVSYLIEPKSQDEKIATERVVGFIEYVISCRQENTSEWMEGLASRINDLMISMRVTGSMVATYHGGFQIITPQDMEETRPEKI